MGRGRGLKRKDEMILPSTPITITLYEADDEIKKTYSRTVVPWGILKKAIALTKSLDTEKVRTEEIDAIAGLVVETFSNQFSIQDLDAGADVNEMISVLQSIVTRASALVQANPTVTPGSKKPRSR
jgi:hypothetical protein